MSKLQNQLQMLCIVFSMKALAKIFGLSLLLSIVFLGSVHAESEKLDGLFLQLKNAENESEAIAVEGAIWNEWMKSKNPEIDALMREALRKRNEYDLNGAIEIFSKVIELAPDFSEGWNQRAIVYFNQEEYEKSLVDIAKTLELEPRHFGALGGRAVIRLRQFKHALARQSVIEAMKHHPFLKERHFFPDLQ